MPRRLALLVATYRYQDAGLHQLTAPGHDAEALAEVLRDPAIADFDVTILVNKPHHVVGDAISEFYHNRRRDDLTLLYFTGHGLKDDQGRLYLAMTDTRRDHLLFTALSAQQIDEAMESCSSRQKVLVLDCCYSGAFPTGRISKADPQVNTLEKFQGKGRVVLTASDATQYSFEGNQIIGEGTRSVFTRFLVEGLTTGDADLDSDGDISLDELYSYVHDRVIEEMPQQRPKKQENIEGRIVIAQNIHWSLPSHIRDAIESPFARDRLAALEGIAHLHRIGNDLVRAEAINQTCRLIRDDSKVVSAAAMELITSLNPEQARREADEQARREAEEPRWGPAVTSTLAHKKRDERQVVTSPPPLPLPADDTTARSDQLEPEAGADQYTQTGTATGTQTPPAGSAGSRGADPAQARRWTAVDFAIWPLRSAQARREADGQNATKTRVRGPIGLPASWGLVIIGVILFVDGCLLTTIPSLSTLAGILICFGFIPLVVGAVTVVKTVRRRRRDAEGQNATETRAGEPIGPPANWGLDRLIRHQMVLAASVGLGIISLIIVLVVVITSSAGTISVDPGPWKVALTPDGRRAYVTNYSSNNVSVIDTASNTVIATIPVDPGPWEVALTPDGRHAYVTNNGFNRVSVIDTASNVVTATIPVGDHPQGAVVTPDGLRAYVTNNVSNSVSVIDTASNTVTATIPVGVSPQAVAVTPDGRHAYVTNYSPDNVSVIDTASNTVTATIPVGLSPLAVAVTPDGRHAYVTNYGNSVSVIDTASNTVTTTIPVGLGTAPGGVAVTPDGLRAYVTNNNSNSVSVIDTASNTVTTTIPVGASPEGVVVTPDGRRAYVVNSGSNSVSVIDIDTDSTVPVELERFYRQDLAWGGCSAFATTPSEKKAYADPGLQCSFLEVPLDYAQPNGQTVKVGLLRRPASDRAHRIGSLVINPGGPGESGMSTAANLVNQVTNNDLGRRFDFVGFDPRGVGSSKPPVLCRTPAEWDAERLMNLGVDTSPAGVARTESQEKADDAGCVSRTGTNVLANIGTREVVRDMDVMRSALGDKKLTYLGYSYGAVVGASYAESFPGNVRAMIFDGAVDPAQDPIPYLIDQGRGFQQAFDAFAAWCAGSADCTLGQDKSQAVKAFHDRVLPLIDHPVSVSGGRKLSYTDATMGVIQALSSPDSWPTLNHGVQELDQGHGDTLMYLADTYYERSADGTYSTSMDAFQAVTCVDNPPVQDPKVARDADAQYRAVAPFLDTGRPPSRALDNCAFWPVPPTRGPHHPQITGLSPVVVISTTHDPAIPYQAGVNLARDLNGRLLTFEGTQHTAFLQRIGCVDNAGITYLATLKLPPEGTRCKPAS